MLGAGHSAMAAQDTRQDLSKAAGQATWQFTQLWQDRIYVTGQSEAAGQLVLVEQDMRHVNQTRKVSPRGRTVSRGISVPRGKIIRGGRSGHVAAFSKCT
jgi:hypothetical protein